MKQMICALLAFVLLLGLAGCKKDRGNQLEESQMTLEAETTEETTEEITEEMTEETVEETETTEETEATVAPCAEHTWGEWVRWEKPSTTTEGKRVRTCVVCGEEDVEIEPTLPKTTNHTHKYKVEKSTATCLEDGWAYYYCSCGDWYEVPLKATGHKWGSWKFTKIPTDTAKGLKVRICESCKAQEEEQTPSFREHTHKYYEFKNEPTCTKAGAKGELCSVCGYSNPDARVTIPALGHKWKTKEVVKPTCTKGGYTVRKCSRCKIEEKIDKVPASGHTFIWKIIQKPTCEEKGTEEEVCNVCHKKGASREVNLLGHDWSDWQDAGTQETRTCSRCGKTETRDIAETTVETTVESTEEDPTETTGEGTGETTGEDTGENTGE